MRQSKQVLFSFILLIIFGCHKQEPSVVTPDNKISESDKSRLVACSGTNFTSDLLEHQNTLNLFDCIKWHEKFNDLYEGIEQTRSNDWNFIFQPLSKIWLEGDRRDVLLTELKVLDRENALDDLSYLLKNVSGKNYLKTINSAFKCTEDKKAKECENRKVLLTKNDLKDLFKILYAKKETFLNLSSLVSGFRNAIKPIEAILKMGHSRIVNDEKVESKRIGLINSIALKLVGNIDRQEKAFITNILNSKIDDEGKLVSWLYKWTSDTALNEKSFLYLYKYPVSVEPQTVNNFKKLGDVLNTGLLCSSHSNFKINYFAEKFASDYLKAVADNGYEGYLKSSAYYLNIVSVAENFCPELRNLVSENHSGGLDIPVFIDQFLNLFQEKHYFKIFEYVVKVSEKSFKNRSNRKYSYPLELMSGDIIGNSVALSGSILNADPSFPSILFSLIKNLDANTFGATGNLARIMMGENYKTLQALAKYWLFLKDNEKGEFLALGDLLLSKNVNTGVILDFIIKIINEYSSTVKEIERMWFEQPEVFNDSLSHLVEVFQGTSIQKDLQRFFDRDQLIKVIEILAKGLNMSSPSLVKNVSEGINNDQNLILVNANDFAGVNFDKTIKCLNKMANNGYSLYRNIDTWPKECEEIRNSEISLEVLSILNEVQTGYKKKFNSNTGVFSDKGITSPSMLHFLFVSNEAVDEHWETKDGVKSGGVPIMFNAFSDWLFKVKRNGKKDGFFHSLEPGIKIVDEILNLNEAKQVEWRNLFLNDLVTQKSLGQWNTEFSNIISIVKEFSVWNVNRRGNTATKSIEKSLFVANDNYDCENFLNQNMGTMECPDEQRIKNIGKILLHLLKRKVDDESPSLLSNFLRAFIPSEGLDIPLENEQAKKYWLTPKETLRFLYDLSDKKIEQNNKVVTYTNTDEGLGYYIPEELEYLPEIDYAVNDEVGLQKVTTLERIEASARDSRVKMNYMAAHYTNAIAKAEDYVGTVEDKEKLVNRCVKYRFCGKGLNSIEKKLIRNTSQLIGGLIDINQAPFNFGNYMKTLMAAIVSSSAKDVQEDSVVIFRFFGAKIELPKIYGHEKLKSHNGQFLTRMAQLSVFSNLGRRLHARFNKREQFEAFMNSKELNIVNDYVFNTLEVASTEKKVSNIIEKALIDKNGKNFFDILVEWSQTLNSEQRVLVEDVFAKIMLSYSFIGAPDNLYKKDQSAAAKELFEKFKNNSGNTFLDIMDVIIPHVVTLQNALKSINLDMMELLKPLNVFMNFFQEGLMKSEKASENIYYQVLNDGLLLIKNILLTEFGPNKVNGKAFLVKVLENQRLVNQMAYFVNDLGDLFSYLEETNESGETRAYRLADNINKVMHDQRFSAEALKNYLLYTSSAENCNQSGCQNNQAYDEVFKVISYFASNHNPDESNLSWLSRKILLEKKIEISDALKKIFANTELVSVPLSPNY